jgi:hypothetical protein
MGTPADQLALVVEQSQPDSLGDCNSQAAKYPASVEPNLAPGRGFRRRRDDQRLPSLGAARSGVVRELRSHKARRNQGESRLAGVLVVLGGQFTPGQTEFGPPLPPGDIDSTANSQVEFVGWPRSSAKRSRTLSRLPVAGSLGAERRYRWPVSANQRSDIATGINALTSAFKQSDRETIATGRHSLRTASSRQRLKHNRR